MINLLWRMKAHAVALRRFGGWLRRGCGLLLAVCCVGSASAEQGGDELRVGYAQTSDEAKAELERTTAATPDLAAWRQRSERLRVGILRAAGLSLEVVRDAPPARLGVRRVHEGYSTQNVALETLPGFFSTGTLYLPATAGRHPAVLLPHGHFKGERGGRFHSDNQILAATLARAGALVLSYDMVGWGDSRQWDHAQGLTLGLQLWNSIRAVDYLSARDDVDASRLAVTGASGGATQTFLLAAVDLRIAVSVPIVQVSAYFFGGCPCESGLPIHASAAHRTNNVEIAALAAPRPQLLVTDGQDWTQHTPEIGFPFIRRIYELQGRADAVELAHFPAEGHDLGPSKGSVAARFLARHLQLGPIAEREIVLETPAEMSPWPPASRPTSDPAVTATVKEFFRHAVLLPFPSERP